LAARLLLVSLPSAVDVLFSLASAFFLRTRTFFSVGSVAIMYNLKSHTLVQRWADVVARCAPDESDRTKLSGTSFQSKLVRISAGASMAEIAPLRLID
jgi:hypothetical protein